MLDKLNKQESFDLGRAQSALDSLNDWLSNLDVGTDTELLRIVLEKIEQLEKKIRYAMLMKDNLQWNN